MPTGTYGSDWRKVREAYVRAHPFCEEPGCGLPVAEVHHIVAVRDGGDRLASSNLRSLCVSHHKSATRREIGARRRREGASAS